MAQHSRLTQGVKDAANGPRHAQGRSQARVLEAQQHLQGKHGGKVLLHRHTQGGAGRAGKVR